MNRIFSVIEKICVAAEFAMLVWIFFSFVDVACHNIEPGLELWLGNANFVKIICSNKF